MVEHNLCFVTFFAKIVFICKNGIFKKKKLLHIWKLPSSIPTLLPHFFHNKVEYFENLLNRDIIVEKDLGLGNFRIILIKPLYKKVDKG